MLRDRRHRWRRRRARSLREVSTPCCWGNFAANLQELILKDQAQAAPSGQISLRIIDQATRVGAIDIYLVPQGQKFTAVTPLITNVSFPMNTGYLNVPTGTYTLVIVPTGNCSDRHDCRNLYRSADHLYRWVGDDGGADRSAAGDDSWAAGHYGAGLYVSYRYQLVLLTVNCLGVVVRADTRCAQKSRNSEEI